MATRRMEEARRVTLPLYLNKTQRASGARLSSRHGDPYLARAATRYVDVAISTTSCLTVGCSTTRPARRSGAAAVRVRHHYGTNNEFGSTICRQHGRVLWSTRAAALYIFAMVDKDSRARRRSRALR